MKANKSIIGAGILSAVASSLCCITPLLAILSGSTGFASTFGWMEPFRPYLIGFTVLVLAFAWLQQLKPKIASGSDCDCELSEAASFFQGKIFLVIVTVFAGVMLAFPYFSASFYPKNKSEINVQKQSDVQQINISIIGMTCVACEAHVDHQINELDGIISVKTSYDSANTLVIFDQSKTNVKQIEAAVNITGYTAVSIAKQ